MHFTKANWFLGFFGKFYKRVNRLKNYVAWICLVEILICQPRQSFSQSVELPIVKSSSRLVYCGNEIRNLFTVSDFNRMASDNPDMSRMAEQFNFGFPLLQKPDKIAPFISLESCFCNLSVIICSLEGEQIIVSGDSDPTNQNNNGAAKKKDYGCTLRMASSKSMSSFKPVCFCDFAFIFKIIVSFAVQF